MTKQSQTKPKPNRTKPKPKAKANHTNPNPSKLSYNAWFAQWCALSSTPGIPCNPFAPFFWPTIFFWANAVIIVIVFCCCFALLWSQLLQQVKIRQRQYWNDSRMRMWIRNWMKASEKIGNGLRDEGGRAVGLLALAGRGCRKRSSCISCGNTKIDVT